MTLRHIRRDIFPKMEPDLLYRYIESDDGGTSSALQEPIPPRPEFTVEMKTWELVTPEAALTFEVKRSIYDTGDDGQGWSGSALVIHVPRDSELAHLFPYTTGECRAFGPDGCAFISSLQEARDLYLKVKRDGLLGADMDRFWALLLGTLEEALHRSRA